MKTSTFSVLVSIALLVLGSGAAYSQDGNCTGHEVLSICEDDFICHFENEYCGTPNGTINFCSGAWGLGICTEGAGNVNLGDADLFSASMLEIECQVVFTQLPGQGDHAAGIITKYVNHDAAQSEWGLFVEGNMVAHPSWELCGDGTTCILSDGGVEINTLYCVRGWLCRNGYAELWVNGERVASGMIAINSANTTTSVIIANSASGENYFHGMIDEVRMGCINTIGTEPTSWGTIKSLYR